MKRLFAIALAMAFALALPAFFAQGRAAAQNDFPCNPSPRMIIACRQQGGTFNFGACECQFH